MKSTLDLVQILSPPATTIRRRVRVKQTILQQIRNHPIGQHRVNVERSEPSVSLSVTQESPFGSFLRLTKAEQEELDLALKLSTETVVTAPTAAKMPVSSSEKEDSASDSAVSSGGKNEYDPTHYTGMRILRSKKVKQRHRRQKQKNPTRIHCRKANEWNESQKRRATMTTVRLDHQWICMQRLTCRRICWWRWT